MDQPNEKPMSERERLAFEGAVNLHKDMIAKFGWQDFVSSVDGFSTLHTKLKAELGIGIETPAEPELTPAVPVKRSVQPDAVTCLDCGKSFKSLKRHLRTHHNLTPDEYRQRWGLPADYPMAAPNYSAVRSQLAKDNGLGRK